MDSLSRSREQYDPHLCGLMVEFAEGFESGATRHRQVKQKNFGLKLARKIDGFHAITRFGHHFEAFFSFQQPPQPVAENRVIVGY